MKAAKKKRRPSNLEWVENLYEVGPLIRTPAREISWRLAQADKQLADAVAEHAQCLADINLAAAEIERKVAQLWTPEEIATAKRGGIRRRPWN